MHTLQEKFQIIGPEVPEKVEGWAEVPYRSQPMPKGKFNVIPDLNSEGTKNMPLSLAGDTDVSCGQTTPETLVKGFEKIGMKGCDDQYTGEHVDHFYGDAGGFVERNNYLDRM